MRLETGVCMPIRNTTLIYEAVTELETLLEEVEIPSMFSSLAPSPGNHTEDLDISSIYEVITETWYDLKNSWVGPG